MAESTCLPKLCPWAWGALPARGFGGDRSRGPGPLQIGYGLTALIRVPQLMSGARVCPQVGSAW